MNSKAKQLLMNTRGRVGKKKGEQWAERGKTAFATLLPLALSPTIIPSIMLSSAGKSTSADSVPDPPAFFSTYC